MKTIFLFLSLVMALSRGDVYIESDDVAIPGKIKEAIYRNKAFSNEVKRIQITRKNGVIILSGFLTNSSENIRLVNFIRSQGYIRIKNEIKLRFRDQELPLVSPNYRPWPH